MNKYALVTGGSRGIGRAISIELAKMGYTILINYLSNTDAAQQTMVQIEELGGKAQLMPFDVSDYNATTTAITQWQQDHPEDYISVLVNNAGVRTDNLLVWMEPNDFEKVIHTNLFSFYNVTRPLLTPMIRNRHGRIINVASLSGITGLAGQCNYSAAKGGLIAATKALAKEVAKKKVTVNAVAPGFIESDMTEGLDEKMLKQTVPMNRFGTAQEVAALVGFLASDNAAYITGECISINGGLYT